MREIISKRLAAALDESGFFVPQNEVQSAGNNWNTDKENESYWLGTAKPDDPVFKEGWTGTMWPGVWKQFPTSDSTPNDTENTTRDDVQPDRDAR